MLLECEIVNCVWDNDCIFITLIFNLMKIPIGIGYFYTKEAFEELNKAKIWYYKKVLA